MSRAFELFERLRVGGIAALDELISDREPESLFVDFKQSPSQGSSKILAADDNKNLSRAISGFANASGGVVVWGVDCRRNKESGIEDAVKAPLIDAKGFATKLQSAVSRTTIPPHPGVQIACIDDSETSGAGYCVVYVPQSGVGPIRSLATNNYHVRAGSDFTYVPHDVWRVCLADSPNQAPNSI